MLWRLGIADARARYARGVTTPTEVLNSILQRVDATNPTINAFATLDIDGARVAAAESDRRYERGQSRGPLDGAILTVKDNIAVAHLPCMWGTEVFRDFVPKVDETPVARLRQAGVVILGKTNVSEFSNGRGIVSTPLFGTTRNPWRPEATTGSSSGGAAAAVATGLGAAALATDGGGSIRIPASYCGLFGLKPSVGQVARAHGLPVIMAGREVIGPIGRSPVDLDMIMRVIAHPHEEDAASWPMPGWPRDDLVGDPSPQRILHLPIIGGSAVASMIDEACDAVAGNLQALGHVVEVGEVPFDLDDVAAARLITRAGMAWLLRDREWRGRTHKYYESITDEGNRLTAADYVEATAAMQRIQARIGILFKTYDLILSPVTAKLPGPAEAAVDYDYTVFTAFANIAGIPAIAIPACLSSEGFPIGFHLSGRFGRDRDLLMMANQYQRRYLADLWPPI